MPVRSWILKPFFFLVALALIIAPLSPASASGSADPGGPNLPTPIALPDGGSAFFFPVRPDVPAGQPDTHDPHLVASGFGMPPNSQVTENRDDRENYDPTSWAVYEHQTSTDVFNTAITNNYRVVDLFVETGASLYTAVYVANVGSYARTWWILTSATPASLLNFAISNNARIVAQKALNDPSPGGSVLFYAVLISNTGTDAKTWYFYKDQSVAQLTALWQNNNARLVQINSYVRSATTYYDAVMVSNTGADARTWYWYVNATPAGLGTLVNANNARVVDLDYDAATGNYNAIMTSCSSGCPAWWWYFGVSTSNLLNTVVTQNGARLVDVNVRPGCGDQCWDILLIDNSTTTIAGNAGLPDVTISYTNGSPQTVTSDASGYYSFSVHTGWSGTVTPSKTGYAFTPASRSYSNTFSNALSENYTAAAKATFEDVPTSYWAWLPIEILAKNGITSGCSATPKLYCPGSAVTRDQMAVFLLRAEHGQFLLPTPVGLFADVPVSYWAAAFIEQLFAEGITSGCSATPKLYCPTAPVTRAQMAIFLLRAKYGSNYTPPAPTGVFADVPVNYWASSWIEKLAADGITSGCSSSPKLYCPESPVTRDQMSVFLVRAFGLK